MSRFSNMNKGELRLAAQELGVDIDGLNNKAAAAALEAVEAGTDPVAVEDSAVDTTPEMEAVEPVEIVSEVAAPVDTVVVVAEPVVVAPPVVRPPRAESNGVKQPSPGTICRQIWDHCDSVRAAGEMPRAKAVREWGAGRLDDTTMTIQFYRWRKFNGIAGRQ